MISIFRIRGMAHLWSAMALVLTTGGLATTPHSARAQALEPISVIVFPGGFNWPIWVAQQKGYFSQNGIEVKLTNTPNSVFQLTGLIEGRSISQ